MTLNQILRPLSLVACAFLGTAWIDIRDSLAQEAKRTVTEAERSIDGQSIFDGSTLKGWSGLQENWRVEDGAITGENFEKSPIGHNTFLVFDRPVKDFELKADFKISGGNSGIQYRSKLIDKEKFIVGGYQADIDSNERFTGINYEERGRGILVERGDIVRIESDGQRSRIGTTGDPKALISKVNATDWNTYRIVAKGMLLQHFINDVLMSEIDDRETDKRAAEGIIALQLHAGPPMKIQFKNLILFE